VSAADSAFILLGDTLWLDFVNTAPLPPHRPETLPDAAAYLHWMRLVRLTPDRDVDFGQVRQFRTRLQALAQCLDAGRTPSPAVTEVISGMLSRLEGTEQLLRVGGSWRLRFQPLRPPTSLEAIAASAAATLANPVAAVRRCAGESCGLYLADFSAEQSRRWCSPSRCGRRGQVERRRVSRAAPMV
jgi:predicted RNA-binding Zn ribbon-like protein